GDLVINGRSTKDFKDRDWDGYRNHSVGFVFQSYNLIPHQTVLQNVELALSLSGVSRSERKKRARLALERVGLGDQLRKRPSEMSGGQMQRVAIARAIVNDPDIILADEPTGALDSETSVQVMDILKEISKDRLVIMVTHNPDLAETYSTRIVRMLDGVITSDSSPMSEEEIKPELVKEPKKKKKERKPSMSFATSFALSLKNLFTKKGRTILTSFAGSIGIIGIALIYAVSNGMTAFINGVQEDTLSSYPLTIEATTVDISTLMQTFMGVAEEEAGKEKALDKVYSQSVMVDMITALNNREDTENDLRSFKSYIEKQLNADTADSALNDALSGVQYTYNFDLLVYTKDEKGDIVYSDTQELLTKALSENLGLDMVAMMNAGETMGFSPESASSMPMMGGSPPLWNEMLTGKDGSLISPVLESQYDVVYGSWPNSKEEIVLVLNEYNELDDLTLYALGLETKEEIDAVFDAVKNKETYETKDRAWTYEEICDMEFRVVLNSDCYKFDEITGLYTDLRETESGLRYLYDKAMKLRVSGIIRPSEDATSHMLGGAIGYTKALTDHIVEQGKEAASIKAQLKDEDTDIFTGLPFKATTGSLTDADKETEFKNYIEDLSIAEKADTYIKI
ncbi:MAG: ABC transporter ATP-binding protein, partial [Clostridia bacterium]|nr:ABC transporter ATP-binding protein [Clostridia bacterium]